MEVSDSRQAEEQPLPKRPLWTNRDFLLRLSGETISTFGSAISDLAFPLLVLILTGSPAQTGLTLGLEVLPFLLFSLPAGAWIDRWNRKYVMIFCDLGRALILVSIPLALFTGHLTIIQLYCAAFVEGTLAIFFEIAGLSGFSRIVSRQQVPQALTVAGVSNGTAAIVGQPISSFLFFTIGRSVPFLFDAVSYVLSAFSLLFIKTPLQQHREATPRHLRKEIVEGFMWLWERPLFRFQALLGCGLSFVAYTETLVVLLLAQRLHALSSTTGFIFLLGSLGGIVGSLIASPVIHRFNFGQIMISTFWMRALLWPLYALAPSPLVLGMIMFGLTLVEAISSNTNVSYRLALVPDHVQGRVNSVHRLFGYGIGRPLGVIVAGALCQSIGVIPTILIFFAGWIMLAISMALNVHVRNVPKLAGI